MTASTITAVMTAGRWKERGRRLGGVLLELWRDKAGFVGALMLLALVLMAVFAPWLAPHDPTTQDLRARLKPPAWAEKGVSGHLLGTDHLGRDVLSRVIYGSRVSLLVGMAVVLAAGTFGVVMGLLAGYRGGRTDAFIMRWIDTQVAFPGLLLALIILAVIGPSMLTVIVVLSLNGWMVYGRMTRSAVLSVRQTEYVEAAEVVGCRAGRVIFRHILPNLTSPLITLGILEFARIVLAEAALSFLGLGIQPPATSWGLDVATGKDYIFRAWWLVTMPGIAISVTVLAINLVASWMRLISDPQEREKQFARQMAVRMREDPPTIPAAPVAGSGAEGPAEELLSIRDLVVHFTTRQGVVQGVRGVDLSVGCGEILGIVGESGSGKSVTVQSVMGLITAPGKIVSGDIRWKGSPLVGPAGRERLRSVRGKEISMIFQDPMTSLNPVFTVGTQIGEGLRHHLGMSRSRARTRAAELLDLVDISAPEKRLKQYPNELSGGMRQRVMIAMALACEPELLIADEPTTALDVTIQAQILELIADLQQRLHLSVIMITHDLGVIAQLCDRVAVMYAGKVVETGSAEAVFRHPAHPYTQGLLSATPRLDEVSERMVAIDGVPPNLIQPPQGCAFHPRCRHAQESCLQQPVLDAYHAGREVSCWCAVKKDA